MAETHSMNPRVHATRYPAVLLALRFAAALQEAERFTVALSGGGTPKALFQHLVQHHAGLPWERVHVFQVDERCVPPGHEDSNWRMINGELLAHLPVAAAHRMEAERGEAGARDYEALIRAELPDGDNGTPAFDLILLGMGDDGHTASLFPGTAALDEKTRLVVHQAVPQLDTHRVTMTYPLIRAARRRWFLAAGADKRPAFAQALRGEVPAGRVDGAEWFVDDALAGDSETER